MPPPAEAVKKVLRGLDLFPFPTPDTKLEPPPGKNISGIFAIDFLIGSLPDFSRFKTSTLQSLETASRFLAFDEARRFKKSMAILPEIPLAVLFPPLLPFYYLGRDANLLSKIEDAFDRSGIAQGLREFWTDLEKARTQKMQCLQSDSNKTIQSFAEDKIKQLITSYNGRIFSMENVEVTLGDGRIHIKGTADFPGLDYKLELVIKVGAKNGKVKGHVEKFQLDGKPIGSGLLGLILDQMRASGIKMPKNPDLDDLSWIDIPHLATLEVRDGEMTMEYSEC